MKIFIIGMPGCGKSTFGKELAVKMGISFFDLDDLIVKKGGASIPEIFEQKGEDYFRHIESDCLKEATDTNETFIMATGGGAPCFHDNMDFINQNGISIFLDVNPVTIAKRILSDGVEERPLFRGHNYKTLGGALEEKRKNRISFYRLAQFTFKEDEIDVDNIIKKIKPSL
ncbi:shikimate kinase [Fulvivirgaceae bacterium BMA10]|uniref:Shikimate kinase n=1 Tax=Splendidivirga corallicola TaxID=3051826 RepID=A0ABT8KTK2_9BACT|nr:shikimate kinase [Fulvivirgaceae bacterium BMA10]